MTFMMTWTHTVPQAIGGRLAAGTRDVDVGAGFPGASAGRFVTVVAVPMGQHIT